jgi:hypothetical protein
MIASRTTTLDPFGHASGRASRSVSGEVMPRTGGTAAHEETRVVWIVFPRPSLPRQGLERQVEHLHVVFGGVGARAVAPQDPRGRLARGDLGQVEVAEQRAVTEGFLPRGLGCLLVGVGESRRPDRTAGWSRRTARSLIDSAPSAMATAISARTRPGKWIDSALYVPRRAASHAAVSPLKIHASEGAFP